MGTITCPSGMQLRIRGMKVREEKILTDRKLAKNGEQLNQLLVACVEELVDPGKYTFEKIDWSKVLQGDRFFTLLKIREESYGTNYEFVVNCENRQCRERFEWELDTGELVVKPLSPSITNVYAPIAVTLPVAQVEVKFHLGVGADEARVRRLRKGNEDSPITVGLLARIDEIAGIDSRDARFAMNKRAFIEDLAMADVAFLRSAFDEFDCGVETSIQIDCPECGHVMAIDLPFGETFFLPKTRKKGVGSSQSSTESSGSSRSSTSAGSSTEAQD